MTSTPVELALVEQFYATRRALVACDVRNVAERMLLRIDHADARRDLWEHVITEGPVEVEGSALFRIGFGGELREVSLRLFPLPEDTPCLLKSA